MAGDSVVVAVGVIPTHTHTNTLNAHTHAAHCTLPADHFPVFEPKLRFLPLFLFHLFFAICRFTFSPICTLCLFRLATTTTTKTTTLTTFPSFFLVLPVCVCACLYGCALTRSLSSSPTLTISLVLDFCTKRAVFFPDYRHNHRRNLDPGTTESHLRTHFQKRTPVSRQNTPSKCAPRFQTITSK